MDAIFKRRSVRKFKDEKVSEDHVTTLLKAAMRAPSAGNEQPWEFVVIQDKETMAKIIEFHPYAVMLNNTPCTVVVCGNIKLQKFPQDFWIQDCSAATENILLEAVHLGLGAVWLGLYPIEERTKGMQALLGLPEDVIPLCAVAVGHPVEESKPADTFMAERIHREKW